jgi:hypothetical protein
LASFSKSKNSPDIFKRRINQEHDELTNGHTPKPIQDIVLKESEEQLCFSRQYCLWNIRVVREIFMTSDDSAATDLVHMGRSGGWWPALEAGPIKEHRIKALPHTSKAGWSDAIAAK